MKKLRSEGKLEDNFELKSAFFRIRIDIELIVGI
jgi:hypothetical protein